MQLSEKIGPVVINVTRCAKDIATIGLAYVIICSSFSFGLVFILKLNRDTHYATQSPVETNKTLNITGLENTDEANHQMIKVIVQNINNIIDSHLNSDQKNHITFNETFKTLFWNIVDTGRKGDAIPNEGVLGEFTYIMYFTYNILIVIVLLNLLIAIMNSTVQRLEDRRQLYWKYTRTSIWIEHFDDSMALPMPYSCLHIFRACLTLFKKLKKISPTFGNANNCDMPENQKLDRLKYIDLIKELSRRLEEDENDRKNEVKSQSLTNPETSKLDLSRKSSLIQQQEDFKRLQEETEL